jgi:hypothetical protein
MMCTMRLSVVSLLVLVAACGSDVTPNEGETLSSSGGTSSGGSSTSSGGTAPVDGGTPECTRGTPGGEVGLIPGPGEADFDAALATKIAKYDRMHEAVHTYATGLAATVSVTEDAALRAKLESFVGSKWQPGDVDPADDLMQYAGISPEQLVTSWGKSTGMYAGAEIAADAFRYAVLRDRGGECGEVDRARAMLTRGLARLHDARAIAGGPYGFSIARSIARKDLPGDGAQATYPLFANGKPFPAEKNNGTWRADNSSGASYANLIWEDSCSRDMLFGWTLAMASAWEVVKNDSAIDATLKSNLQADARSILAGLQVKHNAVTGQSVDLELWDPDGRRTFHGNLHETSVDRNYIPFVKNGPASMMALGEVAGLAYVADTPATDAYLNTTLLGERGLAAEAAGGTMSIISLAGERTNHSSYNMLFFTGLMAGRYVSQVEAKADVAKSVQSKIYLQGPSEWGQALYDLVFTASTGGASVSSSVAKTFNPQAMGKVRQVLGDFPPAPFYGTPIENCDASEVASGRCTLADGTAVNVSSAGGSIVADRAVPIKVRPPSNFFWRSNPFEVNGGFGANVLMPGSDVRLVYWLGRYLRVAK